MKVSGSNNISKLLTSLLNKVNKSGNVQKSAIITGVPAGYGMGVSVENPQIAALEKHFEKVPDFEYNSRQQNLVINGPLMVGAEEELLEV